MLIGIGGGVLAISTIVLLVYGSKSGQRRGHTRAQQASQHAQSATTTAQPRDGSKAHAIPFAWFHGCIPQETVEILLCQNQLTDGTFLVSQPDASIASYVLSLSFGGAIQHFTIDDTDSGMYVNGMSATASLGRSVVEIVAYLQSRSGLGLPSPLGKYIPTPAAIATRDLPAVPHVHRPDNEYGDTAELYEEVDPAPPSPQPSRAGKQSARSNRSRQREVYVDMSNATPVHDSLSVYDHLQRGNHPTDFCLGQDAYISVGELSSSARPLDPGYIDVEEARAAVSQQEQ